MPEFNLDRATESNPDNISDYSVDAQQTEGATGQDETEFMWENWSTYYGYYKKIPELKRAINAKAVWTVGKGYKAGETVNDVFLPNSATQVTLNNITGYGEDTFNQILKNMIITMHINGDAFCEIIRDEDSGLLLNLKPLDPGSMKMILNKQGIIKRYEQVNKLNKKTLTKFKPNQILHFVYDRIADNAKGTSIIESVEECILRRNEALSDWRQALHRNVKPIIMFKLKTDDQATINKFIAKMDACIDKGKNIYIPGNDEVQFEILTVPANATLNPMPSIEYNEDFFYKAVGVPSIILGGSKEFTEATAKISYLVFQQDVEESQLYIETQIWEQLGLKIELDFPVSLQNDLLSDEQKDANSMNVIKPGEMSSNMNQE